MSERRRADRGIQARAGGVIGMAPNDRIRGGVRGARPVRRKGERRGEDRGFGARRQYREAQHMWAFVYRGSGADRRTPASPPPAKPGEL